MPVLQLDRQAHVALGTVKEFVTTTDSTNSASVAVVLILILVVKEIALQTCVFAKLTVAILTSGLNGLAGVAKNAYQFCDFFPIHCVRLLFVVTKSAGVHLVAAWSHEFGLSLVVLATVVIARNGKRLLPRGRRKIHAPDAVSLLHLPRLLAISVVAIRAGRSLLGCRAVVVAFRDGALGAVTRVVVVPAIRGALLGVVATRRLVVAILGGHLGGAVAARCVVVVVVAFRGGARRCLAVVVLHTDVPDSTAALSRRSHRPKTRLTRRLTPVHLAPLVLALDVLVVVSVLVVLVSGRTRARDHCGPLYTQ